MSPWLTTTSLVALGIALLLASPAAAQSLCDVDGNGQLTEADGVAVLHAAAGLAGDCTLAICDVDGNGTITDTDGVNVFRAAAELSSDCGTISEALPANIAAAGDSITQAFAADCDCNSGIAGVLCVQCLLEGDQPQHSWFDGNSNAVVSVHDNYRALDASIGANKSAAEDGSEMLGGDNDFAVQAAAILAQVPLPDHVEVELGGNDICGRGCVDPANCNDPLYTDAEWTAAVRAGLDQLVAGLPLGSTILLLGVPRVHDLRQAGLDKQADASDINCEALWSTFDVCTIATSGDDLNGESIGTRLAAVATRQRRYNEILRDEAAAYNANTTGQNPRGIEVVADYVDEATPSVGTTPFGAADINGGDCFHPSVAGQQMVADVAWLGNPDP